jgi:hypothetical protein
MFVIDNIVLHIYDNIDRNKCWRKMVLNKFDAFLCIFMMLENEGFPFYKHGIFKLKSHLNELIRGRAAKESQEAAKKPTKIVRILTKYAYLSVFSDAVKNNIIES